MKSVVEYKRFFAFSESNKKFFNTRFESGINLIHGKNTSGKSTLIQAIHYTFGINDEKHKLKEVLDEKVVFRLDLILRNEISENISIIRFDDFLVIKRENQPIKKYIGISADNSADHKALKEFLGDLFGFTLYLESSGSYKPASLEAMFLPYYVAQDVGWVYRHKSFRGLDFVKNFKNDFFDYYLGIINDYDREEKETVENEKKKIEAEIKFFTEIERKNDELKLSRLKDEKFVLKANEYIEAYKKNKADLIKSEKEYLLACNKLAFLEERKKLLNKVKRALKQQNPLEYDCPMCHQSLPQKPEDIYEYVQDYHDTDKQIEDINNLVNDLKETNGKINLLGAKISELKRIVAEDYSILIKYNIDDLTFNSWIDNKVNVNLSESILKNLGELLINLNKKIEKLKEFKTNDEIEKERQTKEYTFKKYFEANLLELGVKDFDDHRFLLLYKIPAFPKQGVELLKTLLAYNFAFIKLIKSVDHVHVFPLIMDAIFKEDIDDENRGVILTFIYNNKPIGSQIIMSISDSKNNKVSAEDYNTKYLNNSAHLIRINNSIERAFLSDYDNENVDYLEETLKLIE